MTPELFQRTRELFEQAQALSTSEQNAFLSQQCTGDGELLAFVRDLLRRAERQNAERRQESAPERVDRLIGVQLGPYRIRGVLGQGGMGAVYEAEHERTRQVVALKLIRPGLATTALLRRFEFELKVLARLEHPGIARIYHADTTDIGGGPQPYFAMELVRGQNLIEYATEQKLGIRQRLELAARIADAVQYAHQQGVIHRDLKPGNIFVTSESQPKILDFGVARATDNDVQSTTLQTDIGQLIGTLPYMSPEQAGGDPNQIDTRSDVYALGVVLYELLTGRLPYLMERRLIHEVVRIIKEEKPTRLSSLNKTLRGDVETIVGKALEKEKDRRYASANALAADLRRYLDDDPIAARPPSATYQLRKFAQRNKALVCGLAGTIVMLSLGLIGTTYGMMEAGKERERAETALAAVTKSRDETRQVADFQADLLRQVDPANAGVELMRDFQARFDEGTMVSPGAGDVRDKGASILGDALSHINTTDLAVAFIDRALLTPAAKRIEEQLTDQPLVAAVLQQTLADQYETLGKFGTALSLQERALATRERMFGREHPETLASLNNMGFLLRKLGRFEESEQTLREALTINRRVHGELDDRMLTAANNLGLVLTDLRRLDEAESLFRDTLDRRRRVLGNESPITLDSIHNMGYVLHAQKKYKEAEPWYREAVEKKRRILGADHWSTLISEHNLARLLGDQGNFAEAEALHRDVLEKRRRVLGDGHPATLISIYALANTLVLLGRYADAEPLTLECVERNSRRFNVGHPATRDAMGLFVRLYEAWEDAEPGKGYGEKAAEWRIKLAEARAATRPAATRAASAP